MVPGCSYRHIVFSFQVHRRVHKCTPSSRRGHDHTEEHGPMTCTFRDRQGKLSDDTIVYLNVPQRRRRIIGRFPNGRCFEG
jgi:hypothetical protein